MREIYFDNAATTRVYPEVADIMTKLMREEFGNPSSMHRKGVEAETELRAASKTLAGLLKVKEKEIIFTSGGTESDNWALVGAAQANARRGRHIITTSIEHSAVSAPAAYLEEQGWEVTRLGTDENGIIRLDELEDAIREDTVLVSVMFVNNEIGTIQPIAEIGERIRAKSPGALFHTDAVQAFGKVPVLPKKMRIDLLSVSAHKIHGPKGAGFLYVDEKAKIDPLIRGGGQQNGMRSGTDNVPGAVGLATAAAIICGRMEENAVHLRALQTRLASGLQKLDDVRLLPKGVFSPESGREDNDTSAEDRMAGILAPHILCAAFPGVRSEVLLHSLEERGIYVSAGSACATHRKKESATLKALGCSKEEKESFLRFSFCAENTEEEIDELLSALGELLPTLRRFTRK